MTYDVTDSSTQLNKYSHLSWTPPAQRIFNHKGTEILIFDMKNLKAMK